MIWSFSGDLNPKHLDYKSSPLPIEILKHVKLDAGSSVDLDKAAL